eukprot:TRINITY_DN6259_c0_g1_i7.p1 TRINITY_DN6259_c0_g1~~TRINITY_DN6259_c0_g1_i7.p1  ORF type:complete len:401 (-),score=35.55 TRINITY_DN6259_c0_g1_i7:22-1188(-)
MARSSVSFDGISGEASGFGFSATNGDRQAPRGRYVCSIYLGVVSVASILGVCIVRQARGMRACESVVIPSLITIPDNPRFHLKDSALYQTLSPGGYGIAMSFGQERNDALKASALVVLAFISACLCTVTAAYVVTFNSSDVQEDFEIKATLSNTCQDVTTPRGRMFAVMLFVACIFSSLSMYTLCIYTRWFPWLEAAVLENKVFESRAESNWRIVWAIVPNIGLMYTALLPSLSNNEHTNIALSLVHNIAAPLAVAFACIMETVQLAWGENAIRYFFCGEEMASLIGPLHWSQRGRVVILFYVWSACLLFLSIQVYLGVGSVLGVRIKTSYSPALVSFYSEITALMLIFLLPAFQGLVVNDILQMSVIKWASDAEAFITHMNNGTVNP